MNTENIKKIGIVVSYVATAAIAAFVAWSIKPDRTEVQEKIKVVEVEKQVVVEKEVLKVEVVRVKDTQVVERWRREKTETQSPDGTVVKKETEEKNIESIVKEKETAVKVVEVEKQVIVEKEKLVKVETKPVLPNWHVSVSAGLAPRLPDFPTSPIMLGVDVERRIAGPVFLGGYIMGGSPVTAFQPTNVAVGVKVGIEL
jgi:hypothetical protein